MSALAVTTTVAALLISSPSATDLDRLAANSGFLLGNAHRCGMETDRLVAGGEVIRELIAAGSRDAKEREDATARFAKFFMVSAFADPEKEKVVASCPLVAREFASFEKHRLDTLASASPGANTAPAASTAKSAHNTKGAKAAVGATGNQRFRLSDGE